MDIKKRIAYLLITILVLNIILFSLDYYSYITFWLIIIIIGAISYKFYKE